MGTQQPTPEGFTFATSKGRIPIFPERTQGQRPHRNRPSQQETSTLQDETTTATSDTTTTVETTATSDTTTTTVETTETTDTTTTVETTEMTSSDDAPTTTVTSVLISAITSKSVESVTVAEVNLEDSETDDDEFYPEQIPGVSDVDTDDSHYQDWIPDLRNQTKNNRR